MINHVSVGVRDIKAARRFYDASLSPLGYKCLTEGEGYLGYGAQSPQFWVLAAHRSPRSWKTCSSRSSASSASNLQ